MATKTYSGDAIDIAYDSNLCIHSRNCALNLPGVFDPARRPWIDANAARAEDIAATIRRCPSGALTYIRKDGGPDETPPGVNRIRTVENGPYAVAGSVVVDGRELTRATLCRCGASANKPHCDFYHVTCRFQATGEPRPDVEVTDDPVPVGGTLAIRSLENGPYEVTGDAEIVTGMGQRVAVIDRAKLCRCGHSSNKPFCDGTHAQIGFEAPGGTQD